MSKPVLTITSQDSLESAIELLHKHNIRELPVVEAARLLLAYRIGSLPVVEGEKLVGIISVSDLLKKFIEQNGERVEIKT